MPNKKTEKETSYTKGQALSSKKYEKNKDILEVLLDKKKTYSFKEIDSAINKFKKRKV